VLLKKKQPQFGDKLHKFAQALIADSPEEMYHVLVSQWKNPVDVVLGVSELPLSPIEMEFSRLSLSNVTQKMMYLDLVTYLPNDILVKVDRASMSASLESRAPFLNHQVVEFASNLPLSMKIRDGQTKWLLRQVLYQYIPKYLIERPKMGFSVPIDTWLKGPLREWAENLLAEDRLRKEGFFYPEPIREKWEKHLQGQHNWQYPLWAILMFQAWLEQHN